MRFAGSASGAFRRALAACLLAAAVVTAPCHAQSPDALELYRQGLAALDAGRFHEARRLLLDAVDLNPDFPGAWLDLALATAGAGDLAQAEEFLDILEARFGLPDPIAGTVAGLRARLSAEREARRLAPSAPVARSPADPQTGAGAAWQWRPEAQAAIGYDSNANAGLSLGDIALTLPGGSVVLPLDPGFRPRSDLYGLAQFGLTGRKSFDDDLLSADISLRHRRNLVERDFDTLELRAGFAFTSAGPLAGGVGGLLPGPWRVSARVQQLRLGGSALQNAAQAGIEHVWPELACQPLAGLEFDYRVYPVARTLDARYLWLGLALRCPGLPLPGARQTLVELRAGHADARHESVTDGRPGGDTRHLELTLAHDWAWRAGPGDQRLRVRLQWEHARDSRGYSPLLADNAVRVVRRSAASFTWSLALDRFGAPRWRASLDFQRFRQDSTLALFELSGRVLQLGLQRSW